MCTIRHFYPRSPCGERHRIIVNLSRTATFLSTLSLRRATRNIINSNSNFTHFYPRSPCGERPARNTSIAGRITSFLSTLSLRRATNECTSLAPKPKTFLSTLSLRRATQSASYNAYLAENISIHALLAESDLFSSVYLGYMKRFLSTLSLRRAT